MKTIITNPDIQVSSLVERDEVLNSILPYPYLSLMLEKSDEKQKKGNQWRGKHFLFVLRYASNLSSFSSTSEHAAFTDRLGRLESLARDCSLSSHVGVTFYTRLLQQIDSLMSELRELFIVVPKVLQGLYSYNEVVACFIHFLVEVLEELTLGGNQDLKIILPREVEALWEKLRFLLAILGDKPFQCTQLEETNNVLREIESMANEAGIFLHSFFFTMDRVTCTEMDRALSLLLPKFVTVEAKIKEHCVKDSSPPTRNTTPSFSLFIVDSVLDDLNHLINHSNADFIINIKDQITALYEELNYSRSFLIQDHKELQQDKELIALVKQILDLAYEVEYIIGCFVAKTVPLWYVALRIPDFIRKNKLISASHQQIEQYSSIRNIEVSESPDEEVSLTHVGKRDPIVDENILGFEEKTTEIVTQLVRGPDSRQIVSIVGMGGIGKTTLAKILYNHSSVVDYFDRRSWCVVSQTYKKKKLLIDILKSTTKITEEEASHMEEDALGERIYKNLIGNRYLLVMDDIWDKEAWDAIIRYFPNNANGSRILFTSRNKDVADDIIHELPLLSVDECWDLLQRKLVQKGIYPSRLEDVGRKIAANCKGLPLAVVGIAGVLANMKMDEISWHEVASRLSSFISKDQDILELSYMHLPARLKPCFLYLGMFEEDAQIPVKKLFYQWISQGFIPKRKDSRIEDVAKDFLMELSDRSMVQVSVRWDNEVETCKMHDLIRDMCLKIGEKENFVKVIKDEISIYEQHHHLSNQSVLRFGSRPFGLHTRSLLGNFSESCAITSGFKALRVLQRSKFLRHSIDDVKLSFLQVHLRYLELQGPISSSMRHVNLEYLLVKEGPYLGEVLLNMPKLRHVEFKYPARFSSSWDISKTNGLETISGILMNDSKDLDLLTKFSRLHRLKCTYMDCTLPSGFLDLSTFTLLESLKMTFLHSYISTISFPNNIKKLTLSKFYFLTSEMLSSIGKLSQLEILKLSDSPVVGKIWNTNDDEFQKLKYLKLRDMLILEWNISADHFPQLGRLVLKDTGHPKFLPSELGYIPTLRFLEVYGCHREIRKSAMRFQEEQVEDGNEFLKIIINGDYNLRL